MTTDLGKYCVVDILSEEDEREREHQAIFGPSLFVCSLFRENEGESVDKWILYTARCVFAFKGIDVKNWVMTPDAI